MIDTFRRDLIAVLPAWIVARLLVVGTMLGVRLYVDHLHDGDRPLQVGQGLLAWDGRSSSRAIRVLRRRASASFRASCSSAASSMSYSPAEQDRH